MINKTVSSKKGQYLDSKMNVGHTEISQYLDWYEYECCTLWMLYTWFLLKLIYLLIWLWHVDFFLVPIIQIKWSDRLYPIFSIITGAKYNK